VPTGNQHATESDYAGAQVIWDYHHMHHELRSCDVAIGLGSHGGLFTECV
jgi:hypothetical protein